MIGLTVDGRQGPADRRTASPFPTQRHAGLQVRRRGQHRGRPEPEVERRCRATPISAGRVHRAGGLRWLTRGRQVARAPPERARRGRGLRSVRSACSTVVWSTLIERNAFALRRVELPVLSAGSLADPGAAPLRPAHAAPAAAQGRHGYARWPTCGLTWWSTPATRWPASRRSRPRSRPSIRCWTCPGRSSSATTTSTRRCRSRRTDTSPGPRRSPAVQSCRGRTCVRPRPSAVGTI